MEKIHQVYLDHAAATYLDSRVTAAMAPYWEKNFGNPSSLSSVGRAAKAALGEARKTIARILHAEPAEIIFTGSATESDNLSILGVCKAWEESELIKLSSSGKRPILDKKRHIVTSSIEHHAVLRACQQLEKEGYEVSYLPVDASGLARVDDLRTALRDDTLLVSIMYANNEIGTVQPIAELAALCRERGVYFHTDACQAAGALPLDVQSLGVDLMTLNASKIYGPKGVGLLYVAQGVKIRPLTHGGGQEFGLRSGTENLPGVVGFAKALELLNYEKSVENKRLIGLRRFFLAELQKRLPEVILNGHITDRLPNNLSLTFPSLDAESLILFLDEYRIACASGSACDTVVDEPSHVLKAIGLTDEASKSTLRFTLGRRTSKTDLEYAVKWIVAGVQKLTP